ncbi:MAG: NERD domain-containing protein, partial [Solirubrobacterales bacterium]|nr:NERD domain-containing protein [Solirubrobacterales bacterium]
MLDGLRERGWLALHDVQLGRGNIDHVLIRPAGIFTVETKAIADGCVRVRSIRRCSSTHTRRRSRS